MKNIYSILISLLLIISYSCNGRDEEQSKSAFKFILNEVIEKKYGTDFGISSQIYEGLSDSILKFDLNDFAFKSNFDINSLYQQNKYLRGKRIENFIPNNFTGNIRSDTTNEYPTFFKLGPPLFNNDNSSFIMYFKIYFYVDNEVKWTHQYFICEKREGKWALKGWLDLDRDK
jgi:hypothetical protein